MRRSLPLAACAVLLSLAPPARAGVVAADPIDPFLCYKAKTAAGATFTPDVVAVDGGEGVRDVRVSKPKAVCGPALVDDATTGIPTAAVVADALAHLASYDADDGAPHAPPGTVCVDNELDEGLVLETARPSRAGTDRLLLPSAISLTAVPTPLGATEVDAFACYKAALPAGVKLPRRSRLVDDVLGPARLVDLKKPKHLCLPVAVDAATGTIAHPDSLLVCYDARPAKGAVAAPALTGVHVGNALGTDQRVDAKKRALPAHTSRSSGSVRGDLNELIEAEGTTRPGVWSDLEGDPRWAGGGELGEGDWLRSSFSDAASFPDGVVDEWRVFVVVDITQNETGEAPGVGMVTTGIPGIPDGLLLRPKASGKPRGLRVSSEYFAPPEGTTLAALAGATQDFDPRGDDSDEAFAFVLKDWGVEYRLTTTTGGSGAGPVEEELCVPSLRCD